MWAVGTRPSLPMASASVPTLRMARSEARSCRRVRRHVRASNTDSSCNEPHRYTPRVTYDEWVIGYAPRKEVRLSQRSGWRGARRGAATQTTQPSEGRQIVVSVVCVVPQAAGFRRAPVQTKAIGKDDLIPVASASVPTLRIERSKARSCHAKRENRLRALRPRSTALGLTRFRAKIGTYKTVKARSAHIRQSRPDRHI